MIFIEMSSFSTTTATEKVIYSGSKLASIVISKLL
jgi:hypothetical protein